MTFVYTKKSIHLNLQSTCLSAQEAFKMNSDHQKFKIINLIESGINDTMITNFRDLP